MAYVTPGTVAAGDVATAAAWNVVVNDVIDHETRISSSGLVHLNTTTFSALSTTLDIDDVFSATYENYYVMTTWVSSVGSELRIQFRTTGGATTATTSAYYYAAPGHTSSNANGADYSSGALPRITLGSSGGSSDGQSSAAGYFFRPFVADYTMTTTTNTRYAAGIATSRVYGGAHAVATSYAGVRLFPNTGNITGTFRIFGVING